jgi:RNA polymerase-binding protein DksA
MDEQVQQRLRSELETHRQALVAELRSLGADPDRDRVQRLTGIDDNFADSASATSERAETIALVQQTRERLGHIDHALKRMSDGTYGTCERCGNTIATPRLEARPMSVHCVECAAIVS